MSDKTIGIVNLFINIFPNGGILDKNNFDQEIYGSQFSTDKDIFVNKVNHGYSILYRDDIIINFDTKIFLENCISLMKENLPGTIIRISIKYLLLIVSDFWIPTSEKLKEFKKFLELFDDPDGLIEFECVEIVSGFDDEYDDDYDEEFILDEDDEDEDFLDYKSIYRSSRLIRSTKNVKRQIKKHGIIISSDKDNKKYDREIIKSFLKDFIPGDSDWIRIYRRIMLERWMDTFVISKKTAKELQKMHEKNSNKKSYQKNKKSQNRVLDLTSKLFNDYDLFSDPSR